MAAAKLVVMYPAPNDVPTFERIYQEEHVPMAAKKLAGKTKLVATKVQGSPQGRPPFHRIVEVFFPSLEVLQACLASAGGKETLAHAATISSGGPPLVLIAEEQSVAWTNVVLAGFALSGFLCVVAALLALWGGAEDSVFFVGGALVFFLIAMSRLRPPAPAAATPMVLTTTLEAVHNQESFLRFAQTLLGDRHAAKTHPDAWQNDTLEDFLEASIAWAKDSDFGQRQGLAKASPWKKAAVFLYAGKIYE